MPKRDPLEHKPQRIVTDDSGVRRFQRNKIVAYLLDLGPFDMNAIALVDFPERDRRQFAQLIGYSVDGYNTLSYAIPIKDRGAQKPRRVTPKKRKKARRA